MIRRGLVLFFFIGLAACGGRRLASGSAPLYGAGAIDGTSIALSGIAGGRLALTRVAAGCRGYAQRQPSHVITTSGGPLRLTASGTGDTTLAVRLPNGQILCDDDSGGSLNPLIDAFSDPGDIEVWVGSYSGSDISYTLMAAGGTPSGGAIAAPPPTSGGTAVAAAPPPTAPPPVASAPAPQIVMLEPRIPTTVFGAGVTPTVAVWTAPGASVEFSATQAGSGIHLSASVNGVAVAIADVPIDATNLIVTVTERDDRSLLVRAERAPNGSDPGVTMLWRCEVGGGTVSVADSWNGTASERGPRWSR